VVVFSSDSTESNTLAALYVSALVSLAVPSLVVCVREHVVERHALLIR